MIEIQERRVRKTSLSLEMSKEIMSEGRENTEKRESERIWYHRPCSTSCLQFLSLQPSF